jgi:teichuronic acid biosynthesis glycosyltransferase TuaC
VPRLAVVSSYFPIRAEPHRGHSAYQTLRRMTSRMEIEVFCPLAVYPSFLRPRNFSYVRADPSYSPPDVRARYIDYPALPLVSRPLNGAVCARSVLPHLERFKPDLILSYYVYPDGYAAVSCGKRLGVPVILGAIGSDINRIPDRISTCLTRKALREASFVLTVSEHLRKEAVRLGASPERTRVVRNGCDTAEFRLADRAEARIRLGLDAESEVAVFVGWIAPTKGLRELVDAINRLRVSHPRLQLFCIGEGAFQAELEVRATDAGSADRIRFLGRRGSPEVASWLAAANVFCLPSYAEGCPNSVIEALACGRPVVGTRVGGIPELVDSESGILVAPGDSEALAAALHEALSRPWNERRISERSQRGWDQVAEETFQICMDRLAHHDEMAGATRVPQTGEIT